MRGIPASAFIIFFSIILLIEILAYLGIIQLVQGRKMKRVVTIIFGAISFAFIGIWLSAFLNPDKIRETSDYAFFYFVISLTILNVFPKAVIGIFAITAFPLRLIRFHRTSKAILLSGVLISSGILFSIAYGLTLGKSTTQVNTVDLNLPGLPPQLDQLKVVQISDLHLGSFDDDKMILKMAEQINFLQPDILVFTGDLVNNFYTEVEGFENALAQTSAKYGKYAIWGNHDYGDYSNWKKIADKRENHRKIGEKIREAGFNLLQNQSAKVQLQDTSIYIIGVENWGHKPFPQYAELDSALIGVPEESFQILLSHDPAHWADEVLQKTSIPITLSGHTHGAQFGLKVGGVTFSPMYFVQNLWAGLYRDNNQYLYVNQGFGCVGFPGRIDMNPEITLLILHSDLVKTH